MQSFVILFVDQVKNMMIQSIGKKCNRIVNSESSSSANGPIVVLAGWLGCQPKSLKRYEQMYLECGFQTVVSKIATPAMVVNAILNPERNDIVLPPHGWPLNEIPAIQHGSMKSMAWDVLREIHQSNSSFILFHSFSNGGFFLWENVRQILSGYSNDLNTREMNAESQQSPDIVEHINEINAKLGGLVFDSCPSVDIKKLPLAMQYVGWWERLETIRFCGVDHLLMSHRPDVAKRAEESANESANALRDSFPHMPHLFLYSEDDHLADFHAIDAIVAHRMKVCGPDKTFSKRWESSNHCGHLRRHPDEYRNTVEKFVRDCWRHVPTEPPRL